MASSYSFYGDRYSDGALQFSQPIPHPCKTKTRNTIALSSFSDGRFRSKVNSIKEDEEKKVQLQKDPPTATSKGDVNACGDCCCCRVFYSDRFREFSSDTTLHGLRYAVAEGVEPWRRFLWTVLLVIAVSATAVYMYLCWYKFFSFPVNTVVTLTYKSKLRFPAITICNYNQYRKSVVKGTRFEEWVRQQYPLFNFSDDDVQVELDESILEANRTWFDQMAAHSKWSMIYQCTFGSVKIPCSASNFTETFTDFGVCYTFNGADREGGALLVGHSGSEHGLRMRLFVNQSEYTFGEHCGAGFKILPHPQDEVPLVRNFGFAVSPGTEALVGLKMIQEHNLPAPYASQCSNETLQYFAKYARSNCVRERQTDAVVAKCGCREPYMPSDARVCNYNETRVCVRPELERIQVQCPMACESSTYAPRVSYAMFPGRHIVEDLQMRFNLSYVDIRENVVDVKIYFEEISLEEIYQEDGYPISELIGATGGELGLCLGASLLTVYEILEFVGITLWRRLRRWH